MQISIQRVQLAGEAANACVIATGRLRDVAESESESKVEIFEELALLIAAAMPIWQLASAPRTINASL